MVVVGVFVICWAVTALICLCFLVLFFFFFFFSSRRRHTRLVSDWSSDVCSSDLGFGELTTTDGHKIWYSGDDTVHQHGVAFIVKKENVNAVIECTPISNRLISIRIAASPHNITIIQA